MDNMTLTDLVCNKVCHFCMSHEKLHKRGVCTGSIPTVSSPCLRGLDNARHSCSQKTCNRNSLMMGDVNVGFSRWESPTLRRRRHLRTYSRRLASCNSHNFGSSDSLESEGHVSSLGRSHSSWRCFDAQPRLKRSLRVHIAISESSRHSFMFKDLPIGFRSDRVDMARP